MHYQRAWRKCSSMSMPPDPATPPPWPVRHKIAGDDYAPVEFLIRTSVFSPKLVSKSLCDTGALIKWKNEGKQRKAVGQSIPHRRLGTPFYVLSHPTYIESGLEPL